MFLETTPDTSVYMIAGYALTFITMGIYVASMYIRNNNLKRDLETLETLEKEDKSKNKGRTKK